MDQILKKRSIVKKFIRKLYAILKVKCLFIKVPEYQDWIAWNQAGTIVEIKDQVKF